jgi:hypothetical protein
MPLICYKCKRRTLFPAKVNHDIEQTWDGATYFCHVKDVPALQCQYCFHVLLTDESRPKIDAAFRAKVGILGPLAISQGWAAKQRFKSIRDLAELVGVRGSELERIMTGQVYQTRELDLRLRDVLGLPPATTSTVRNDPGAGPANLR